MRKEFLPAVELLQKDLAELETKVSETKKTINRLYAAAGEQPLYPDVDVSSKATISAIRPDTFYGKAITTAAREFLDMRRAANLGPATAREVYEALVRGGYRFETKDETNALISVRATLRKNSSIFHRLPNGEYGLLNWYPGAKAPRGGDDD